MIHAAAYVATGVALGVLAALAIDHVIVRLDDRRRARERAELARHQALPPPGPLAGAGVPPEAWAARPPPTIVLKPTDVIRSLPRRRGRQQNWRNN